MSEARPSTSRPWVDAVTTKTRSTPSCNWPRSGSTGTDGCRPTTCATWPSPSPGSASAATTKTRSTRFSTRSPRRSPVSMTDADEPIRDDHAELLRRRALTEDAARPDAVQRRHAANGRTARENIDDLVDAGTFVEYGRFAIAAQRFRRDLDDLIARTPADGLVAGTARINGNLFGEEHSACAVLSYDY